MKGEGQKALADLDEERSLYSEVVEKLGKKEEEITAKESEFQALAHQVEEEKRRSLSWRLHWERTKPDFRAVLERSVDKEEVVAEFRSSDAFLADQEKVNFVTIEELIETVTDKRPDWDVQFLKDELDELKNNSKFNHLSSREEDQPEGQD
ncbi:hypothetical protein Adt_02974 [Abeliophyllum distichum]|uniref:Uncharacterized protein n=1 Tax=Abeliophyllum distichum TaxID=126358 RepID=A0ABD1VX63_9LAMI